MPKSEKYKMIDGELYNSADAQLSQERVTAHRLCKYLSSIDETEVYKRQEVLGRLLRALGENSFVADGFICDYGYNISVGSNVYINFNCTFLDIAPIHIEDYVLIAPDVKLYTVNHPFYAKLRKTPLEYGKKITIKENTWIGGNCTICPGVTIGKNSIIGGGSVVTKDIPDNTLAVGNPARPIRYLEDNTTDEELQRICEEHGISLM